MKHIYLALLAFTLLLVTAQESYAQSSTNKAPAKPAIAESTPATATPPASFKPTFFHPTESITSYLANDPQKVLAWVEAQVASVMGKPDQFSTQEDRARYENALVEKMKGIGPIPLVTTCQKKYDSERQSYEIKVLLSAINDYALKSPNPEALSLRRLTLARTNIQRDTYAAQNAYGATTEVSRTSSDDYVFAFPAGSAHEPSTAVVSGNVSAPIKPPYRYAFNFLTLTAKIPPNEARDNDKLIACLYVVSLEAPYTFRFREREMPTRSLPFEQTVNGYALFGRLDHVAVIHKGTGQIYDQVSRTK